MFAVGFPTVVGIVVLLPYAHHLAANIIITLLSALGAVEFSQILGKKHYRFTVWESAVLGALSPAAMTLSVSFGVAGELVPASFIMGATWVMASRVFSRNAELAETADRIAVGLSSMIYPGLFLVWLVRMTMLPNATVIILTFLLTVFASDSFAWLFGMLFGKGNRGIIAASPNKSIAGFVGGIAGSIAVGIVAAVFEPTAFIPKGLSAVPAGLLLGLLTGIAAMVGDLAESTIKRSADVKDSGTIIPGRGGVLDSIDSIALAAPVFYALYWLLF